MKRIYLTTFCGTAIALLGLLGTAPAASTAAPEQKQQAAAPGTAMTEHGKLNREDSRFLRKAAEINLTQIQLGKLAQRISTDPNVKKMGEMIIKDHTEVNRQLERLAASKGVTLPTEPYMWNRAAIASLEKEQGEKFTKEFFSTAIKDHEKAIALFEKEASRTQDPDIKAWVQKMVPDLKAHLAMIQSHSKAEAVAEKNKPQPPQQKKETKSNW